MKRLITTMLVLLLTVSISAQSKEEVKVQKRIDEIETVIKITASEKLEVNTILLKKENEITAVKNKYEGDKETTKAELKKLNPIYNRQVRDLLGKERMDELNEFYKAKRAALKEKK